MLIGIFAVMIFSLPSCQKTDDAPAISTQGNEAELKAGNNKARPFKGSIEYLGEQNISLTCNCTDPYFIGNNFKGTGNITHLGQVYS